MISHRTNSQQKPKLISSGLLISCLMVSAIGAWAGVTVSLNRHASRQEDELQVANQTEAFRVISAKENETQYLLRMRNVSQKSINAYALSFSDTTGVVKDLAIGDRVIAPGEIEEYAISSLALSPSRQGVAIGTVVFTDGTSEGDAKAAAEIINTRLGTKLFIERVLPLYQKALDSSNENSTQALDELESQVNSLPEHPDGAWPIKADLSYRDERERQIKAKQYYKQVNVDYGYRNAKEELLKEIQHLRKVHLEHGADIQKGLAEIKKDREKQKDRL